MGEVPRSRSGQGRRGSELCVVCQRKEIQHDINGSNLFWQETDSIQMDNKIDQLAESLIVELVGAMALPQTKNIRTLVRLIFGSAARRLSEIALRLDSEIEQNGPAAGALDAGRI